MLPLILSKRLASGLTTAFLCNFEVEALSSPDRFCFNVDDTCSDAPSPPKLNLDCDIAVKTDTFRSCGSTIDSFLVVVIGGVGTSGFSLDKTVKQYIKKHCYTYQIMLTIVKKTK